MRILLLGATGFVGKHLLDKLSETPELSVTAVIHSRQPDVMHENVQYVTAGLNEISYNFLEKGEYDLIFHLARIPGKGFRDAGRLYAGLQGYRVNSRLLKHISWLPKKPKLIYLSGSLMYGHIPGKSVDENQPLNPVGFGRFYYYAEKPFLDALKKRSHTILMLRAPWIVGNGSWFKQLYLDHINQKGAIPVYGDTERHMSTIAVEDCANMLWHYALNAPAGIYNVFTGGAVKYTDFISALQSVYNLPLKYYSLDEMKRTMDATAAISICSEIVLSTIHKKLPENCKIDFPDLRSYIFSLENHTKND